MRNRMGIMQRAFSFGIGIAVILLAGCRGTESDAPPIHPNLNMDFQERFDPQEGNAFFADNRAMRPKVEGTVPRGFLREEADFYEGRTADGALLQSVPLPITRTLLERGRDRYNIYCTPCHGAAGDGRGRVTVGGFGFAPAPSFHDDRLRAESDGHFYAAITNGIRTMPPYAAQVSVADRWAIVAYIRALQRSQNARIDDVPVSVRSGVQEAGPPADASTPSVQESMDVEADTGVVDVAPGAEVQE